MQQVQAMSSSQVSSLALKVVEKLTGSCATEIATGKLQASRAVMFQALWIVHLAEQHQFLSWMAPRTPAFICTCTLHPARAPMPAKLAVQPVLAPCSMPTTAQVMAEKLYHDQRKHLEKAQHEQDEELEMLQRG